MIDFTQTILTALKIKNKIKRQKTHWKIGSINFIDKDSVSYKGLNLDFKK